MATLQNTLDLLHVLGDETRVRLLALLEREELTVAELTNILELSQSRVSTHLAHLKQAGLVTDRRAGVASFYSIRGLTQPASGLWQLLKNDAKDPILGRDSQRLEQLLRGRRGATKWPDTVAGEMERHYSPGRTWETTARGLTNLLRLGDTLDIGSGDGAISQLVVAQARSLTCLDHSERMVEAARQRLVDHPNARVCLGDMHQLPFDDNSFDDIIVFNALTYSNRPGVVLAEAQRVLRPSGRVAVMCLHAHEHRDIVARYDHVNLGFSLQELRKLHEAAGLSVLSLAVCTRERRKPYFEVLGALSIKPALNAVTPHLPTDRKRRGRS
jgi:ArsR family transcriptional regulator